MSPKKKLSLSLFSSLFLLFLIVAPVSADITLHFVDRAYLGSNPVTVTSHDGTLLFNGTTDSIATLPYDNVTASYWISFEPGGVTDYANHPEYAAEQTFEFGAQHIVGIMMVVLVGIVWFWRSRH